MRREFKKKSKVLLIDDNYEHLSGIRELLNLEGTFDVVGIATNITVGLNLIKKYSIKAGLSIKPNTPVSALVPYFPFVVSILVMSVDPGAGGQEFIPESKERIHEVRALLNEYGINAVINVDGGC